jgi:hypothetical protein
LVPLGASAQASGGERSRPSAVWFLGIRSPCPKLGEVKVIIAVTLLHEKG